jgi:uncharacterized protein YjbI with pentapeptide repeats
MERIQNENYRIDYQRGDRFDMVPVGARFNRCLFKNINLVSHSFRNCQFVDCDFGKASFGERFYGCTFTGCDFENALWVRRLLQNNTFKNCRLGLGNWIISGPTRSDGYRFFFHKFPHEIEPMISAGCRYYNREMAIAHWKVRYPKESPLHKETQAILKFLFTIAEIRGLINVEKRAKPDPARKQTKKPAGRNEKLERRKTKLARGRVPRNGGRKRKGIRRGV